MYDKAKILLNDCIEKTESLIDESKFDLAFRCLSSGSSYVMGLNYWEYCPLQSRVNKVRAKICRVQKNPDYMNYLHYTFLSYWYTIFGMLYMLADIAIFKYQRNYLYGSGEMKLSEIINIETELDFYKLSFSELQLNNWKERTALVFEYAYKHLPRVYGLSDEDMESIIGNISDLIHKRNFYQSEKGYYYRDNVTDSMNNTLNTVILKQH